MSKSYSPRSHPKERAAARILAFCGAVLLLSPLRHASADTTLQRKLKSGETLRYEYRQRSDTETTGAGKPTAMSLEMSLTVSWQVAEVDPQGIATIAQTIDRLNIVLKVDNLAPIAYDSATRATPTGPAKEIAEAVGPLVGGTCTVKMTDRGEIVAVESSETLSKALEKTKVGSLLSAEGLSRVFKQAACQLPEKSVNANETWQSTSESSSPLGSLHVTNEYQLVGTESHEGAPCELITVTTKLAAKPAAGEASSSVKLTNNEQTGKLYFDNTAGRFRASQLQQRLATERSYREMTIKARTTSVLDMKLLP